MDRDYIAQRRAAFVVQIEQIDAGKITHLDEDATGQLRLVTTEERRASLVEKIAAIDRKIAEGNSDA